MPGFLDRYLASKGYAGQMSDVPFDSERLINLWDRYLAMQARSSLSVLRDESCKLTVRRRNASI